MRRIMLLVAATALTMMVASGVALALTRIGTDRPDTLRGDQRGRQPHRQGRQRHTLVPWLATTPCWAGQPKM